MAKIRFVPDDSTVDSAPGETLLAASLRAGNAHAHACGGKGLCTTCRVLVVSGLESIAPRTEKERAIASRVSFSPEIRLACQTIPAAPLTVRRLVLDEEDIALTRMHNDGGTRHHVGVERRATILFSDIRGFTSLSEALPPYDIVHLLNRYFGRMGEVIGRNRGRIDNYMGDGFMALFGVENEEEGPLDAVRAALGMLAEVDAMKPYVKTNYGAEFEIGLGIHCGPAVIGDVGARGAQRLTAIGDAVNVAARVESANKEAGTRLLVSGDVLAAVGEGRVTLGKALRLALKGKTGEFLLHEIVGLASGI